jgi:hypothetical protein
MHFNWWITHFLEYPPILQTIPEIITVQNKGTWIVPIKFWLSVVRQNLCWKGDNFGVTPHFKDTPKTTVIVLKLPEPLVHKGSILLKFYGFDVSEIMQHWLCGDCQNQQAGNVKENESKIQVEGIGLHSGPVCFARQKHVTMISIYHTDGIQTVL